MSHGCPNYITVFEKIRPFEHPSDLPGVYSGHAVLVPGCLEACPSLSHWQFSLCEVFISLEEMLPSVLQKGPEPHMLHSVTHTCKLFLSFFFILSRTQVHIEVAGLRLLFWDAEDGRIWVKICALHCLIIVEEVALRARSALCFTGKPSVLCCHNNMESTQNWFVCRTTKVPIYYAQGCSRARSATWHRLDLEELMRRDTSTLVCPE